LTHISNPAVPKNRAPFGLSAKTVAEETHPSLGVTYHQRYVGKLLKKLGFSHISARPRHPAQDGRIVEAFKKTFRAR
jgi:transposase